VTEPSYRFQHWWVHKPSRRSRSDATSEWKVLGRRLCNEKTDLETKAQEDKELLRLLTRWAIEVPLNIEWYEGGRRTRWRVWWGLNALVLLVFLAATGFLLWIVLKGYGRQGDEAAVMVAELALAFGAVVGVLRIVTAAADVKAQHGLFWETSSRLKARLFKFEDDWAQRYEQTVSLWSSNVAVIEFKVALREQIRLAREDVANEQAAFFRTFRSPAELLETSSQAFADVQGRFQQVQSARMALAASRRGSGAADTGTQFPPQAELALAHRRQLSAAGQLGALIQKREQLQFERQWRLARGADEKLMRSLDDLLEELDEEIAHAREQQEFATAAVSEATERERVVGR
jgi:hypothetical protein